MHTIHFRGSDKPQKSRKQRHAFHNRTPEIWRTTASEYLGFNLSFNILNLVGMVTIVNCNEARAG